MSRLASILLLAFLMSGFATPKALFAAERETFISPLNPAFLQYEQEKRSGQIERGELPTGYIPSPWLVDSTPSEWIFLGRKAGARDTLPTSYSWTGSMVVPSQTVQTGENCNVFASTMGAQGSTLAPLWWQTEGTAPMTMDVGMEGIWTWAGDIPPNLNVTFAARVTDAGILHNAFDFDPDALNNAIGGAYDTTPETDGSNTNQAASVWLGNDGVFMRQETTGVGTPVRQVKEMKSYQGSSTCSTPQDLEAMKAAIYQYGGVIAQYYVAGNPALYYNSGTDTYAYTGPCTQPNHSAWVYGWDGDKFLVRNSWDHADYKDWWVDAGSDTVFGRDFDTLVVDPTGDFTQHQSYDATGPTMNWGYSGTATFVATCFTPNLSVPAWLRSVGVWTAQENVTMSAGLYKGYSSPTFDPTSDTPDVQLPEQQIPSAGYHKIDMPADACGSWTAATINPGQPFCVAVSYDAGPGRPSYAPLEVPQDGWNSGATANPGETFAYNGASWIDFTTMFTWSDKISATPHAYLDNVNSGVWANADLVYLGTGSGLPATVVVETLGNAVGGNHQPIHYDFDDGVEAKTKATVVVKTYNKNRNIRPSIAITNDADCNLSTFAIQETLNKPGWFYEGVNPSVYLPLIMKNN